MKKSLMFLFAMSLLLFNTGLVYAQTISATTYPFTKTFNIATEPMNQPPDGILLIGSGIDEGASPLTNIGFEFWFAGIRYTQFSVESNGLLKLGSPVVTPEPVNNLASPTNSPIITPYWDNLVTDLNNVLYKVYGTAPNRKLVVQWFPGGKRIQSWLWESGMIEFVYGTVTIPVNANGYSVGIGSSATQFASITPVTGNFVNNSTVAYGTANNANTAAIWAKSKFAFTPALPAAPTNLTFTNVSLNGMQLNWTDALNEIGYAIYSSVDNVNFNYVGQVGANVTSYDASGLNSGTRYYWKVHSIREVLSSALTGNQTTTLTPLLGTYTVGPTGDFPSLLGAIYTLNGSGFSGPGEVIFELQASYLSTVESFPIIFPSTLPTSATNTLTIRPAADAIGLAITSSAAQTISLDGTDYVTFDGRPGGVGINPQLKIDNTFATGVALQLINAAQNNSILYCELTGVNTSISSGVVVIGTTTPAGTVGNRNNLIDHCNIHDGATKPAVLLVSNGTAGKLNENNTISNCNFYNWNMGTGTGNARALNISSNNSGTVITGNSFYQTTPTTGITQSTNGFVGLSGSATANNINFSDNFLGGSAPQCGGTPMSLTYQTYYGSVTAINLSVGTTVASNIQGNIIRNIEMIVPTGQGGSFTGINQSIGWVNIGTVTPNIIGSPTVPNSIIITNNSVSAGASFVGISVNSVSSSTDQTTISNNVICGVNLSGTGSASFTGIGAAAFYTQNITVTGNTIGSATMANAISNSTSGSVIGISGTGRYNNVITGNTIANLTQSNSTSTTNQLIGLSAPGNPAGVFNVSNNTIYNLSSASASTGTGSTSSVIGLLASATSPGQVISQNRIFALSNTNPTVVTSLTGLYYAGATTGTNVVSRNFIQGLTLASSATAASINGIHANAGSTSFQNNMVQMGIDASGANINTGYNIHGIFDAAGTSNYSNNSVYIGGSGVAGTTSNTFAFKSAVLTNTRAFQNNIFVNARSGGSTGKHYAISVAGTTVNPTGLTSNYNLLYTPGNTIGLYNGTDQVSLSAWKIATGQDAGSIEADPNFINPIGNSTTVDLHIQNLNPIESSGLQIASVTTDYDGETRSLLTPTDIGADAGNFTNNLCVSPTSAGTIGADLTGCAPFVTGIINSTGLPTGQTGTIEYKWQSSVAPFTTWNDILSNTVTYDPGTITVTTQYQRVARVDCKIDWVGAAVSNIVTITVNPTPAVTTANTATICNGTSPVIALSATVESTYTWTVGTITGGITGATGGSGLFIDQVLTNSGTVAGTVEYLVTPTSLAGLCPGPAYLITVTVNPIKPVSVQVYTFQNPACAGSTVQFFATPINGGASPVFVWKVNGFPVGANANNYAYNPAHGDIITCELTPGIDVVCPGVSLAVSNEVVMVVSPAVIPTIAIGTTTGSACAGSSLTFTASVTNEGATPTYAWKVNGLATGTNSPLFAYTAANYLAQTIDIVTCELTSASPCASVGPVISNSVNITVNPLPVSNSITGEAIICAGTMGVAYGVTTDNSATASYAWSYSGLGATLSATTGSSITIGFASNATSGNLTVVETTTATGCSTVNTQTITINQCFKTLNLTLLLEGLYNGTGTMRQAFDETGLPHWPAGVADHISVELHDAATYATIHHTTLDVPLSTTGTASLTIPSTFNASYFITVKHRNSIETTTATAVSFAGSTINQSFATPADVYGGNLGLTINGHYFIYGGDVNQDGVVDSGDFPQVVNDNSNYMSGYLNTDIDGNGSIDSGDFPVMVNNNFNYIGTSHP